MDLPVVDVGKCVGCGQCVMVCRFEALDVRWGTCQIEKEQCTSCGICLDYCPVEALAWEAA